MDKQESKPNNTEQTTAWLLESETPSIRYLTLTTLMGRSEMDEESAAARCAIPEEEPVRTILDEQDERGFWVWDQHYYGPKYHSSHWSMLLLTEMAVSPEHPKMQKGAQYMLESVYRKTDDWIFEENVGCFWGNWLRYQLYCGNRDDERVQQIIERTCRDIHQKGVCKYNYDKPCSWGVVRDLFGLALIPEEQQDEQTREAIQAGLEFLLEKYHLEAGDYPYVNKIHPLWSKTSFPLFYQADILFTLRVLKELGAADHPGVKKAREWLTGRRKEDGTWRGGSPYRSRTHPFVKAPDTVDRWVTLQAMQALS